MPTRKPPASVSGAKITAADVEAAERDRIVAAALRLQQAQVAPPPMTAEQEHAARLLGQLDRRPTAEDVANELEAARRQEVARRNAEGAEECRQYAARLAASGYRGWVGGDR